MSKASAHWMAWISTLPCAVRNSMCWGPLNRHHLTHGGRPKHDLRSVPLCQGHHHWNSPLPVGHAYHKGTKAWERNYGSIEDMLQKLRDRYFTLFGSKPWEDEDVE